MFNLKSLSTEQKSLRKRILTISYKAHYTHIGSCISAVDIIEAIYIIKKPNEPFVLSNGHSGIALYAVLEKHGFINDKQLMSFNIHPDRNLKHNIYVSSGSLGQGLPIALGMAFADQSKTVYCMISDGESAEGSIWEALRVASDNNVINLKIIVNANGWGAYDPINLLKLRKRIVAFGWDTIVVNGHDLKSLIRTLSKKTKKPTAVFAKTQVAQMPFLKGQDAHYHLMDRNDYDVMEKLLT